MDCKVASVTVSVVEGVKVPTETLMVVGPTEVALKLLGVAPKFPATASSEEDHFVAIVVTSRVLPSLNVPIAENTTPVLLGMLGLAGRMETETRFDKSTVSVGGMVEELDAVPNEARMLKVPMLLPITSPPFDV